MKISSRETYSNTTITQLVSPENFELEETEFNSVTFNNCILQKVRFIRCSFEKCTFKSTDLSLAKLPQTRIKDCHFVTSKLVGIDWNQLNLQMGLELNCEKCDLSYSSFEGVDLSNSIFHRCKFEEALFTDAKAVNVDFLGSDFTKSVFHKTNLKNAKFKEAKNYYIDMSQNICREAEFDMPEALNLFLPFGVKAS